MSQATVLIVDDIEANRNTLRDWVTVLGHNAVIAENGQIALDLATQSPPDLVLLDIMMPVLDGYGVIERMKESRTLRQVPIVVISALDEMESVVRCIELGADDYLTKPFNPKLLRARIAGCLEKYRLVKAERDLLENTLAGSVHALVHLLVMSNPEAFRRAQALRELVRQRAADMGVKDVWVLEVASMLRDIGCMALPAEVAAAIREHKTLTKTEEAQAAQVPDVGYRLLVGIPRMEGVAEVVRYQAKHFDGTGEPRDEASGKHIPLGARVLLLLDDFQDFRAAGMTEAEACTAMCARQGWYDPDLLDLLAAPYIVAAEPPAPAAAAAAAAPSSSSSPSPAPAASASPVASSPSVARAPRLERTPPAAPPPMEVLDAVTLKVGQLVAADIYTQTGLMLVIRGTRLTEPLLARIRNHEALSGLRTPILVYPKGSPALRGRTV